jgi:hypothetical protein
MLRQLYTRELRALAEGRPLKRWGLILARLRTLPIPVRA